jgi:hypothetical protein
MLKIVADRVIRALALLALPHALFFPHGAG